MSTEPDPIPTPDEPEGGGGLDGLREKAKKADEAEARVAQLERNIAFRDAGLDLSVNEEGSPANPMHTALAAGYDGDLAGVAAFVAGLGLQPEPATELTPEPIPDPEPSGPTPLDLMRDQAGGTPPEAGQQVTAQSLLMEGWKEYHEAVALGEVPEDAAAQVIDRIFDAAVKEEKGVPGFTGAGLIFRKAQWQTNPRQLDLGRPKQVPN